MRVAVVGGGPSGLTALKYLVEAHKFFPIERIEARLFEAEAAVGGTFRHRAYEDAELVSSKQLTTFSDFRYTAFSADPDFLSVEEYCNYLEIYCSHFSLWPYIRLSTNVESIRRQKSGEHLVTYINSDGSTEEWFCDAVAVCSGLHVTPNVPYIRGNEHVPMVMHSSDFKERKQYGQSKNIMILGSGETAMDLAYLAITSPTNSVTMCHNGNGFLVTPKRVPDPYVRGRRVGGDAKPLNIPVDCSSASLLDTAYVHPALEKSSLLWGFYDKFTKATLWINTGTKYGYHQWVGGIPDEKYHASAVLFNKSSKAIPYISAPYRPQYRKKTDIIEVPFPDTKGKVIDLAPWPDFIDEKGVVHFTENGRPEAERMRHVICKPDILIYATGYTQHFPFLDSSYPTPQDADIRRIWKSGDESVGFIGFVRPGFGGIPPLSEMQAQLWILSLLNRLPRVPQPLDYYRLRTPPGRRIQYGVDHESYAYQLALDMGSAPSALQVLRRGWKVFLCWALSVNFNTKFRLVGPWKWDGAERVMKTELWDTVARRGAFGNIMLSGLPILFFGTISAYFYVLYGLRDLLRRARKSIVAAARHYGLVRPRAPVKGEA